MAKQTDRVMLKILDHRTKAVTYVCGSKIVSIFAINEDACNLYLEGSEIPIRVSGYSAEDILTSCGFDTVEAKHQ